MPHPHHDHGPRQPRPFDAARAAMLDDPARFEYLPPESILELLDVPFGGIVVDYGTGTGTFAIELARRVPHAHVIAYDNQAGMLELLRAKPGFAELRNLETAGPEALAGCEGSADRVLALNILHELSLDDVAHMRSLLAPGGRILVVDWTANIERPVGPPRDHTYTEEEARERLASAGLLVTRAANASFPYHYALHAERGTAPA